MINLSAQKSKQRRKTARLRCISRKHSYIHKDYRFGFPAWIQNKQEEHLQDFPYRCSSCSLLLVFEFLQKVKQEPVCCKENQGTNACNAPGFHDSKRGKNKRHDEHEGKRNVNQRLVDLFGVHYGFPFVVDDDTHVNRVVSYCQREATIIFNKENDKENDKENNKENDKQNDKENDKENDKIDFSL